MLERDNRPKDVMVIVDQPNTNEYERSTFYTDVSHTNLKDSLANSSHVLCKDKTEKHILHSSNICYTYLFLERYKTTDSDWKNSIVIKRNIPEGEEYIQLEWFKDVWVSKRIYSAIQALLNQIREVKPKLIVIGGKWSFLFLCTKPDSGTEQLSTVASTRGTASSKNLFGGLNKFRGSMLGLFNYFELPAIACIPILTPSMLYKVQDRDYIIKRDYAKIARIYLKLCTGTEVNELLKSKRTALIGYNIQDVRDYFEPLLAKLDKEKVLLTWDIETRQNSIDCIGFAYAEDTSFTVPLSIMYEELNEDENLLAWKGAHGKEQLLPAPLGAQLTRYKSYWSVEEEVLVMDLMYKVLLHKNTLHIGQNLNYDLQWMYSLHKLQMYSYIDTLIQFHCMHNTLSKDLATLASIYCDDYSYHKDEIWK